MSTEQAVPESQEPNLLNNIPLEGSGDCSESAQAGMTSSNPATEEAEINAEINALASENQPNMCSTEVLPATLELTQESEVPIFWINENYPMTSNPRGTMLVININTFIGDNAMLRRGFLNEIANLEKIGKMLNFRTESIFISLHHSNVTLDDNIHNF